jgi:hypothetical protein
VGVDDGHWSDAVAERLRAFAGRTFPGWTV